MGHDALQILNWLELWKWKYTKDGIREAIKTVFRKLDFAETRFDIWLDLSFIFQPILILKDCGASRPANSRLEAGFYTLCEPHVKKAIIFEHEAFRSNNPACFLKLGAYRIPVFLSGTMFHFNWMVININDAEKHLARGEKNNNKPLGVRTERDLPRGT